MQESKFFWSSQTISGQLMLLFEELVSHISPHVC